jgi:hypothetical protein
MQFTKDTFYMTLRARLATLNPARIVTIEGAVRPAVYVVENEPLIAAAPPTECFAISFGAARAVPACESSPRPLLALDCQIDYRTAGSDANLDVDRGRILAQLDTELLEICAPHSAVKQDFTQAPPASLGTQVLWQRPQLAPIKIVAGELRRSAKTTIYFYPEANC